MGIESTTTPLEPTLEPIEPLLVIDGQGHPIITKETIQGAFPAPSVDSMPMTLATVDKFHLGEIPPITENEGTLN